MLRRLCLVVSLVLIAGAWAPARAQGFFDKVELSAGYAYTQFKSYPTSNLNGLNLSAQYKWREWLGVDADFGGGIGSVGGVSSRVYTYLFGPQVSWPHRVSPFAHVLVGGSHFSGGGYTSKGIATGFGLGVDWKVKARLSWRVLEIDDVPTHLGGLTEHSPRVVTGIVYRF